MNTIENGKYVAISYDLFDVTDGAKNLIHQVPASDPEKMVYGVTPNVIEPLMAAISGLKAGDKFSATVLPAEGFDEYNDEMLRTEELPREIFEADGKLDEKTIFVGAQIFLQTSMGQEVPAVVLAIDAKTISVKIDFNHPLAGRTVCLEGKIEEVRPATDEEIAAQTMMGCGCGGGCNCEGDCGSGSCNGCGC
jgi:FKBP-type peptidyl-prolyl cis-trans isomerase SlyD